MKMNNIAIIPDDNLNLSQAGERIRAQNLI